MDRKTSDICYCCFYNIRDTIQYYPHSPSKACLFFFFLSSLRHQTKRIENLRAGLPWDIN